MVAVVVPSPACSEVFEATSRTICAPMFSNLFSSSISLATVTPSLVTRGAPNDLSRTTLRPLGPSVTRTASARMSIPCIILSRASTENFTSLAAMSYSWRFDCVASLLGSSTVFLRSQPRGFSARTRRSVTEGSGGLSRTSSFHQHPHQIAFLHDHVLDAVELDFGPRPLAEQHPVADLDVDRDELAALIATTRADGNDLSFLRFFLGGIRDDDAATALLFSFDPLDDDAIVKWTEFHGFASYRLTFFDVMSAGGKACPRTVCSTALERLLEC